MLITSGSERVKGVSLWDDQIWISNPTSLRLSCIKGTGESTQEKDSLLLRCTMIRVTRITDHESPQMNAPLLKRKAYPTSPQALDTLFSVWSASVAMISMKLTICGM